MLLAEPPSNTQHKLRSVVEDFAKAIVCLHVVKLGDIHSEDLMTQQLALWALGEEAPDLITGKASLRNEIF